MFLSANADFFFAKSTVYMNPKFVAQLFESSKKLFTIVNPHFIKLLIFDHLLECFSCFRQNTLFSRVPHVNILIDSQLLPRDILCYGYFLLVCQRAPNPMTKFHLCLLQKLSAWEILIEMNGTLWKTVLSPNRTALCLKAACSEYVSVLRFHRKLVLLNKAVPNVLLQKKDHFFLLVFFCLSFCHFFRNLFLGLIKIMTSIIFVLVCKSANRQQLSTSYQRQTKNT